MEEKLLKIAVTMSVENILKEMRKFSPEPLNCVINTSTHDNPEEADPEKQHDSYDISMWVEGSKDDIISEGHNVYWHFDPREGEGIRKTELIPREGEQDE